MTDAAGGGAELRLEVVAGNAAGFTIVVDERLVIGRQSEGPGKLADDPEISRHHAEIARVANGQFTVKDLSSTNGTFVNGTLLKAPVLLALDDEIEVGETRLVVRSAPAGAPPPAAPPAVDVRAPTVTVDVPPALGEPAGAPEPSAPVDEPPPEPEPAPLLVRLTVDFETEAARLAAESGGEPIRLELADGQWRVADGEE